MKNKSWLIILGTLLFSLNVYANQNGNDEAFQAKDRFVVRFSKGVSIEERTKLLSLLDVSRMDALLPDSLSITSKLNKSARLLSSETERIVNAEEPLLRSYIVYTKGNQDIAKLLSVIKKKCTVVEFAEPFYLQEVTGGFIPDDSLANEQRMFNTMQLNEAWEIFKGDTSISIGISDSGVLQTHEDFQGTLDTNWKEIPQNGIDDDKNGYIDDYNGVNFTVLDDTTKAWDTNNEKNGHGTGTAGISSAVTNNKKGIAGVGFNTRFVPMKTVPNGGSFLLYGYQSIMYAAQNNIKVINLSWGGGPYSCFQESVIEYARARDVAIVAATGNGGTSTPFYPANYKGILGVGVTEPTDTIAPMSGFGEHLDVFAPGNSTRTTSNNGSYGTFCCTSGAAPIVSGIVALIRGKYPNLTAEQALEHARLSVDEIESKNEHQSKFKGFTVGRINALKALSRDPFALPSLRPESYTYKNQKGSERFEQGDTIKAIIQLKNYLGLGRSISVDFVTAEDTLSAIELLPATVVLAEVKTNEGKQIECSFIIKKLTTVRTFLRVNLAGFGATTNDVYKDFFVIPFVPNPQATTWKNDTVEYSLADNGRIGFAQPLTSTGGIGYKYKGECNMLYEGSLMVGEKQTNRVVGNTRYKIPTYSNDFATVKAWKGTDDTVCIINDNNAPDSTRIGLEIKQTLIPPKGGDPIVRIKTQLKNTSDKVLNDVAVGYFFDPEIGEYADSNRVQFFKEAVVEAYKNRAEAILATRTPRDIKFAVMSWSESTQTEPIGVGFNNVETYDNPAFTNIEKLNALYSGTSRMWGGQGDVSLLSGVKFLGEWKPNEVKEMTTIFGAEDNTWTLRARLLNVLDKSVSSIDESSLLNSNNEVYITPHPVNNEVVIRTVNNREITEVIVYSLLGELMLSRKVAQGNNGSVTILLNGDSKEITTGIYGLLIRTNEGDIRVPIIYRK
jgi:hypothetical protein